MLWSWFFGLLVGICGLIALILEKLVKPKLEVDPDFSAGWESDAEIAKRRGWSVERAVKERVEASKSGFGKAYMKKLQEARGVA